MKLKSIKVISLLIISLLYSCSNVKNETNFSRQVVKIDSSRIINQSNQILDLAPVTLTSFVCKRSLGEKHDFYSEGDYWWPNPKDPNGPYIRKDGMSNPENFTIHRKLMRDMSIQVAALTAAYKLTEDTKYSQKAVEILTKWFIESETKMNPNMNYAQAIKGICAGRGVGLIDGIHLVEVARSVSILHSESVMDDNVFVEIKEWFSEFLNWMQTSENGIDERDRKNNHGTCWVLQASEYARLTENKQVINLCIERFKKVLLPNQLASDGSFPLELARTKPYGYSIFNLDIMSTVCHILSTPENDLWNYKLSDGQNMKKAMEFIYPFIKDKSKWTYKHDVMYWEQWPVRQPSLLFSGLAFNNQAYLNLWKSLKSEPETEEGIRNFPIRQPLLWID